MAEENIQTNAPEQDLSEILKVRREKLAALRAEGRDPFKETRFDVTHHAQDIKDNFDALEGSEVRVAGRLMSKRGMGKVSFCDLQDKSGRIQLYARKDEMDEEEYNRFKKYDIGDIVGVEGEVFRTQRGEMSVRAKKITLLSKSLRPLPEKYHGLTDKEARYRQRYVDLIINPESKRNFEIRSKFVAYLRRYLDSIGFMEVETPVLSPIAGGANACRRSVMRKRWKLPRFIPLPGWCRPGPDYCSSDHSAAPTTVSAPQPLRAAAQCPAPARSAWPTTAYCF